MALGRTSHAGGTQSTAYSFNSFVHGHGLSTTGNNHAAFGIYNQNGNYATDDPFAFMVGNGSETTVDDQTVITRSNAFAVSQNGNIQIAGK
jgi:hypothetical protein